MSNPTGEWTTEDVTTPHHGTWPGLLYITEVGGCRLGSMNEHEAKAVVAAHNDALAAERERIKVLESGTGLNAVIETNKRLREQLAAEREKLRNSDAAVCSLLALAAVVKGKPETPQSLKDLASRELLNHSRGAYLIDELRQLRHQLAAAVEALDRVSRACTEELTLPYYKATNTPAVMGTFVALQQIADAALAKIGGKP